MLNASGKKILKSIHIILVSIWIGALFIILFMQIIKSSAFDIVDYVPVNKLIFRIFDGVIVNISIAVAISGLVFSLFTNWGFFKFRWIIIKWLSVLLLAAIIIVFAVPSFNGMAALSDTFGVKSYNMVDYLKTEYDVYIYTILQLTILIFIVFISVIKPWGQRKQKIKINRKLVVFIGLISGILLFASILMQYLQLTHYRNLPIHEIDLAKVEDGSYIGQVTFGFEYKVKAIVENHKITNIEILQNRDNFYAKLAEGITYKIIRDQKINSDAITGATTTSKVLIKAIEVAIEGNKNR